MTQTGNAEGAKYQPLTKSSMFEILTTKTGKILIDRFTKIPCYKEPVEVRITRLCKELYGEHYRIPLRKSLSLSRHSS